jgi:hypothetical protein
MGRSAWGDVIRNWCVKHGSVQLEWILTLINSRTLARLVWFHVPLRLQASKEGVTKEDAERVLEEKKVFIDLLEGFEGFNLAQLCPNAPFSFAFALKHHLRQEPGPFYEDLYPLLTSLETSPYCQHWFQVDTDTITPQLPQGLPTDGLPTHTGEYGTFERTFATEHAPLLPATPPDRSQRIERFNLELVPGASLLKRIGQWISSKPFI